MSFHRKFNLNGKYIISVPMILLILFSFIPYSYSELELSLNKQIFLPTDYVLLHVHLDYVPNNGSVVQITNPYGELFVNRHVFFDNEGNFEVRFNSGPNNQLTSGFYDVKVTGIQGDNVIIDESSIIIQIKDFPDIVSKTEEGGGCLIATATFGSELAPQVQQLRELRDNTILSTKSGTIFMAEFNQFYYSFSPIVADLERKNPVFKEVVKFSIAPMLASLSILNYINIDTERDMMSYGIIIILMNVAMYFVLPIIVISKSYDFFNLTHQKSKHLT
jgi:hypothetical protein